MSYVICYIYIYVYLKLFESTAARWKLVVFVAAGLYVDLQPSLRRRAGAKPSRRQAVRDSVEQSDGTS